MLQNLSETIKTLRKSSLLTQSQFADRLGVHLQTISKWERGLLAPDFSLLGEIAAVLSVSLEKLLDLPEGEEIFTGAFDMVSFGKALAEARKKKNESQSELAGALGVSTDNISKWERGVTCPEVEYLIALSKHFEMPVSKLYFGICDEVQVELPAQWRRRKRKLSLLWLVCAVLPLCLVVVVLSVLLAVRMKRVPDIESSQTENFQTGNSQTGPIERMTYNISYWLCGGSFEADAPTMICKDDGQVGLVAPQKEGCKFLGWYRHADYSGEPINTVVCENRDITLYAKWSDLTYEIRYDLRGGLLYKNNPTSVTAQESRLLLDPVKEGYHFLGWFDDPEDGEKYVRVGGEGVKNITLYAKWQKCDEKYTVRYNLSGGTLTNENPKSVGAGEVHSLYSPEKRGCDFVGWNKQADGAGEYVTTLYDLSEDITLYAIFEPKTYFIRYVYDGLYLGEETNPNKITFGQSVTLLPVFLYGNDFLGWFTEETNGKKVEKIDESNLLELSVLYARFRPIEYTLTLDAGEGSFTIGEKSYSHYKMSLKYGQTQKLPTPTCDDLVFLGWVDEEGEYVNEVDRYNIEDITLHAKWLQLDVHYQIVYELDGGVQNEKNPSEGVSGRRVPLYEPKKEGYLFLGWFDNEEGQGERYDYISEEREEDIVLYALWQEVKKVGSADDFTYVLDGNTVKITDYTGPWGEDVDLIYPSYIEGHPVTEISSSLGNWVRSIHSITIPESVTVLGEETFYCVTALEPLVIPSNVESIGNSCFREYEGKIIFSESGKLTYIDKSAFFQATLGGPFVLPHGVTTIGETAFDRVEAEGVFLPDTIKTIGREAFYRNWLEEIDVYLPAVPAFIDENAFREAVLYTTLKEEQTKNYHPNWKSAANVHYLTEKQKLTLSDGNFSETKEDFGFVLPAREKEGYTFLGWKNEKGELVHNCYFPEKDETLYAFYEEKSATDGRSKATAIPLKAGKTYELDYIPLQSIYFIWQGGNAKLMVSQQEFKLNAYLIHRGEEKTIYSSCEIEKGDLLRFGGQWTQPGKKFKLTITVV